MVFNVEDLYEYLSQQVIGPQVNGNILTLECIFADIAHPHSSRIFHIYARTGDYEP